MIAIRKIRVRMLRGLMLPLIVVGLFFGRLAGEPESWRVAAVEAVGCLLLVAGVGIRIWATLNISGRKSRSLVTTGPYSLCRNPLYVGSFLVAVGIALCLENVPLAILVAAMFIAAHYWVVRMEERRLLELFGPAYEAYMRTTPRFWPSLRNYRGAGVLSVPDQAIRRVLIELLPAALAPALAELVEGLQAMGLFPVFWPVPWL